MSSTAFTRPVEASTVGYAGGVNLRDAINQLAPDELAKGENVTLDEKGVVDKRLGCESHGTFGAGADRIISMYTFYRTSAAPQVLIHTTAGKLYYTNDPAAGSVTWTQIVTGLSVSAPMSFETFNGKVYMGNGVDDYASWDGTTRTAFATAPKGKFLRLHKDTMWISGITSLPDRTYSSAPGDAETFPVSSWIDLGKGDGDSSTALGSDGQNLIFFKKNRHWIIYDPVSFANRVVDFEKGCESHFSVVQFEGDIFFLSRRGICKYLGDSPAQIISGKMDPLFQPDVLNLAALSNVYAYTIANRIGWSMPEVGETVPSLQLEYYPRLIGVTPYGNRGTGPFVFHRMPLSIFTRVRSGSTEFLYGAHKASNKFLQAFAPVGEDDGVDFVGLAETGAYDFNAPTRTKYLRRLRFLGRGQLVCQIRRNFESAIYKTFPVDMFTSADLWSTGDTWGSGTWGPEAALQEDVVNPDAYARYFQFRFSDTGDDTSRRQLAVGSRDYSITSGQWGIYGITMEGELLGVRD